MASCSWAASDRADALHAVGARLDVKRGAGVGTGPPVTSSASSKPTAVGSSVVSIEAISAATGTGVMDGRSVSGLAGVSATGKDGSGVAAAGSGVVTVGSGVVTVGSGVVSVGSGVVTMGSGVITVGSRVVTEGSGVSSSQGLGSGVLMGAGVVESDGSTMGEGVENTKESASSQPHGVENSADEANRYSSSTIPANHFFVTSQGEGGGAEGRIRGSMS